MKFLVTKIAWHILFRLRNQAESTTLGLSKLVKKMALSLEATTGEWPNV